MLNWSDTSYKFTLGIGSLAITGQLSELFRPQLSVWIAMVIAMLPFVMFVFIHPGELPDGIVAVAHVAASCWYVVSVLGLLLAPAVVGLPFSMGSFFFIPLAVLGGLPCFIVLGRWSAGNYPTPPAGEHDSYQREEQDEDNLNWG